MDTFHGTPLVGKSCKFTLTNGTKLSGIIIDKNIIPLASGTMDYVPMHTYLIKDDDGDVHVVNPINLISVL